MFRLAQPYASPIAEADLGDECEAVGELFVGEREDIVGSGSSGDVWVILPVFELDSGGADSLLRGCRTVEADG